MSYIMISNWSTQEWTTEMDEIGQSKFVPMIMSVGATEVQMVRTGANNLSVISHFTSSEAAAQAKEKIAALLCEVEHSIDQRQQSLISQFDDIDIHRHLIKGDPVDLIPQFVRENAIDTTVMGTVARSGTTRFMQALKEGGEATASGDISQIGQIPTRLYQAHSYK